MKKELLFTILIILILIPATYGLTFTYVDPVEGQQFNGTKTLLNLTYNPGEYVIWAKLRYNSTGGVVKTTVSSNYTQNLTQYKFSTVYGAVNLSTIKDTDTMLFSYLVNYTKSGGATGPSTLAGQNFTIKLNNHEPTLNSSINIIYIDEDTVNSSINLSSLFIDGNSITYTINANPELTISSPGNILTITPKANYYGNSTLEVIADDGLHIVNKTFKVEVKPIEDKPALTKKFKNITALINSEPEIDLEDHFTDYDGDTINYNTTISSGASIFIKDNTATITPSIEFEGKITIGISANDGKNITDGNIFVIVFTDDLGTGNESTDNRPPQINNYSPLTIPPVNLGDTLNFMISSSDPEGDKLTTRWYVNGIFQTEGSNTFSYTFNKQQNTEISAIVSDGKLSATKAWPINLGQTLPQPTTTPPAQLCGNNIADPGETCSTCFIDAPCSASETCNNGICEEKKDNTILIIGIIIALIVILFVIGTIMVIRARKKNTKDEIEKQDFTSFKPAQKPRIISQRPLTNEEKAAQRYAQEAIRRGMTKAQIREALLSKGWTTPQIETILKGM